MPNPLPTLTPHLLIVAFSLTIADYTRVMVKDNRWAGGKGTNWWGADHVAQRVAVAGTWESR